MIGLQQPGFPDLHIQAAAEFEKNKLDFGVVPDERTRARIFLGRVT